MIPCSFSQHISLTWFRTGIPQFSVSTDMLQTMCLIPSPSPLPQPTSFHWKGELKAEEVKITY